MTIREFMEKARNNQNKDVPAPNMRLMYLLIRAQYRAGRMTEEQVRAMAPQYLTAEEADAILAQ